MRQTELRAVRLLYLRWVRAASLSVLVLGLYSSTSTLFWSCHCSSSRLSGSSGSFQSPSSLSASGTTLASECTGCDEETSELCALARQCLGRDALGALGRKSFLIVCRSSSGVFTFSGGSSSKSLGHASCGALTWRRRQDAGSVMKKLECVIPFVPGAVFGF
jgi:hypothetical protein